MPFNDSVSVPSNGPDYALVACSLVAYEDGGGGGGGDGSSGRNAFNNDGGSSTSGSNGNSASRIGSTSSSDNASNSRCSSSSSSSSSSFDDDTCSSWTDDSVSCRDVTSVSSSGSGGDADAKCKNGSTVRRAKWLKSLWTMVNKLDGQRDGNQHSAPSKQEQHQQQQHPVKTILRPPTTYKYVIGMSGLPSKVAVYPKRM